MNSKKAKERNGDGRNIQIQLQATNDDETAKSLYSEVTTTDSSRQNENKRGNWGNSCEFLLSCIGYAVGIGNIWRFPYLCIKNGGGAFLLPYFFFLFTCGVPLFFLELALGQFSSASPFTVWSICPLFKGLGYAMTMVSAICCVYYNVIMSWVLFYLVNSFTSELPWTKCQNTSICIEPSSNATNRSTFLDYDSFVSNNAANGANISTRNSTDELFSIANGTKLMTPAEEYWTYTVLQLSPSIDTVGYLSWELMLCLLAAWVIVFFCLCKGVESSGKVVYVTATAPYVFLTILLVRGLTLDGAIDGILFFLTPDFKMLADPSVWGVAALQIFYSLGPAWGGLITMASFNKFHNNVYRDAMMVPVINCLTSFYGGFVIFSVIGFMAKESKTSVKDVITQGPGLAFVAYPEALTKLPISPLWAVCFFGMLLTIGLDSQFGMLETVISGLIDQFPTYLRDKKLLTCGVVSAIMFLLGLPFVTQAGMYIFQIVDWYMGAITIMAVALIECLLVAWVYGATRFRREIAMMTGIMPSVVWEGLWRVVTPILMGVMLIYNLHGYSAPTYGDYEYPDGVIVFGWILASASMLPIPGYMIYILYQTRDEGPLIERIQTLWRPAPNWGPYLEEYRENYDHMTGPTMPVRYYKVRKRGFEEAEDLNVNLCMKTIDT